MAVLFESSGSNGITGSSALSYSWTHTSAGGPNTVVLVAALWQPANSPRAPSYAESGTSMTYGGTPMTSLGWQYINNLQSQGWGELYYLFNPPSGAQTVTAAQTFATTDAYNGAVSCSYLNVSSLAPIVPVWGTGSSAALTVAGGISESVSVAAFFNYWKRSTSTTGLRASSNSDGFPVDVADSILVGGSNSFTSAPQAVTWAALGVALQPNPIPSSMPPMRPVSRKVGPIPFRRRMFQRPQAISRSYSTTVPPISTFTSTFDTKDTGSTGFGWWGANASVANGKLVLIPTAAWDGAVSNTYSGTSWPSYDLTGNAVFFEVSTPNVSNGSQGMSVYIISRESVSTAATMSWAASGGGAGRMTFATPTYWTQISYNPVSHRFWRIREANGTIYFETSPDTSSWATQGSTASTLPLSNVRFNVSAYNDGTDPNPGVALIDNLNLLPSNYSYTPTKLVSRLAGPMSQRKLVAQKPLPSQPSSVVANPKAIKLTDTFDIKDQMKWLWSAPASVANGRLNLLASTTQAYVMSNDVFDLTESSIQFRFYPQTGVDGSSSSSFIVRADSTGGASHSFLYGSNTLIATYQVQGSGQVWPWQATYDPINHAYLRIREFGGTVYYDTSPDASTWTTRTSALPVTSLSHCSVYIYAQKATGPDAYAYYDDLNVQPSNYSYTPTRPVSKVAGSMALRNLMAQKPIRAYPYSTTAPSISTFTDTFDTLNAAKWWWGAGVTLANGKTVLQPLSSFQGAIEASIRPNTYDLTGDSISFEMSMPNYGNGTAKVYMYVYPAQAPNAAINVQWSATGGGYGSLKFLTRTVENAGSYTSGSFPYDPVAHKFWRIRESGGTIYFETSPDYSSWAVQSSNKAITSFSNVRVDVMCYSDGLDPDPGVTLVDNMNLSPSRPYYNPVLPTNRNVGPMALRRKAFTTRVFARVDSKPIVGNFFHMFMNRRNQEK